MSIRTEKAIWISDKLDEISTKLRELFRSYHHPAEFPTHLNVLGKYLLLRYDKLRNQLREKGAHLKENPRYLVPLNGLSTQFSNMKVYVDSICKVPEIEITIIEMLTMIEYAATPTPILSYPEQLLNYRSANL